MHVSDWIKIEVCVVLLICFIYLIFLVIKLVKRIEEQLDFERNQNELLRQEFLLKSRVFDKNEDILATLKSQQARYTGLRFLLFSHSEAKGRIGFVEAAT